MTSRGEREIERGVGEEDTRMNTENVRKGMRYTEGRRTRLRWDGRESWFVETVYRRINGRTYGRDSEGGIASRVLETQVTKCRIGERRVIQWTGEEMGQRGRRSKEKMERGNWGMREEEEENGKEGKGGRDKKRGKRRNEVEVLEEQKKNGKNNKNQDSLR